MERSFGVQWWVLGTSSGSLGVVMPVEEGRYKRLQDLCGEMLLRMEHVAGVNLWDYRLVKTPHRLKAPSKNVLDASFCSKFLNASTSDQIKWARNKGTTDDSILNDLFYIDSATLHHFI